MCGINGIFRPRPITEDDRRLVANMNREMAYRGPDDEGIEAQGSVCLGMVRLAIIGLGNGHQPIFNENKSLFLVCNGEIYNYLDLRKELESLGHVFRTASDVEVLLHLYEEDSERFLDRIVGMFAFAIYDSVKDQLIIGRDRLGEKPLYYSHQMGLFAFSSEAKTIARHCLRNTSVDESGRLDCNDYSYPQDPRNTIYTEIKRILPGEFAVIDQRGVSFHTYWIPRRTPTFAGTLPEAVAQTRKLFEQAVERTLLAEVPLAVLLSGGIDSSAITAVAVQHKKDLNAITIGYKGEGENDERRYARRLAKDLNLTLHEIEIGARDFVEAFDEYVSFLDEPIGDPAGIMQWHIYKKAKALGIKVLLNGLGGDEIFFGYAGQNESAETWQFLRDLLAPLPFDRNGAPAFLKKVATHPRKLWQCLRQFRDQHLRLCNLKLPTRHSRALPTCNSQRYETTSETVVQSDYNYLLDIYLPLNGFALTDKLSMANSIEVRCPFADADVVNFVLSLPLNMVYRADNAKGLLKEALTGVLPDWLLKLPKKGFTPDHSLLVRFLDRFPGEKHQREKLALAIMENITQHIISSPPKSSPRKQPSLQMN